MKTTDWNAVVTSTPLNKEAAVARDGSGEIFTPLKKVDWAKVDEIPKVVPPPITSPHFVDYSGVKYGRITVIGYIGPSANGASWLVRCACGNHERRRTAAVRKGIEEGRADRCGECDYVKSLKDGVVNIPDEKLFANRKSNEK